MSTTAAQTTAPAPFGTALPVRFERYGRSFGDHDVLADVTVEIAPGEICTVLGPSGCGKSTLLRAAAGLGEPGTGTVLVGGAEVSDLDPRTSFAFQEPRLLPWRTLRRNIELGLPRSTPKAAARSRVDELLDLVGLSDRAELRPREVSGGMAQRVSLARALARDPGVLLLDEPFGALDALTRIRMQGLLLQIHAQEPTTTILVTHDVDEAIVLADRILVLGRPDGPTTAGETASAPTIRPTTGPATIVRDIRITTPHPRDRASAEFSALRAELLVCLGVDTAAPAVDPTAAAPAASPAAAH